MCPATPSKRGWRGFTFAEVLLCVYILAVALLGLMATLVYCLKAQRGGQQRQLATRAAEDLLVELTSALHASSESFAADHRQARTAIEEMEYAVGESLPAPDLKQLAVSVYFSDEGVSREVTLTELVYNSSTP